MNLRKRLSSLLPLSSLTLILVALLSSGSASCGSDQACFYFPQAEFDIDNACLSRTDALKEFTGDSCSTQIVTVDSDGVFDGSTCCYNVTQSDDFSGCVSPGFPEPGVAVGTSGVGGAGGVSTGGMGGTSGGGGAGGSGTCVGCAEFLTNEEPPPLCSDSQSFYQVYSDCICKGPCGAVCASSCPSMANPSMECVTCSIDASPDGCGKEHDACLSDP